MRHDLFYTPPSECMPACFWYLNAPLKSAEIRRQLREMFANGIRSVCPHPFPPEFNPAGMPSSMTPPYLSQKFMKMYGVIVAECEELGMNCYLYDEGGWPSGNACGQVRRSNPEEFAGYRWTPEGILRDSFVPAERMPRADLLNPDVTKKFIELTHERFKVHLKKYFGKTIKFVFTDEPVMSSSWAGFHLTWCKDFSQEFHHRKGYAVEPYLPALYDDSASPEVKIDFHDLASQLFVERYFLPLRKWCRKNGLVFGGHLDGENEPEVAIHHGSGHILRELRTMDLPGVDAIWRQIFPGSPGHIFPKYASSIAHQSGRKLAMGELFAVYGNGITPEQQKYLIDYMLVRGVNALVFSTIDYSTKRNFMEGCRPHLGPCNPLWKFTRGLHEYAGRIAFMLTRGKPSVPNLLYFDQRSFWAGGTACSSAVKAQADIAGKMLESQCDFDFVDDDALTSAKIVDGKLVIGKMKYSSFTAPTAKYMTEGAAEVIRKFKSAQPAAVLNVFPATPQLRTERRQWGKRTIYFCVNQSGEDLNVELHLGSSPVSFWNPEDGEKYIVESPVCKWHFVPYGSALFVTGVNGRKILPQAEFLRELKVPWTLRPVRRHFVNGDDFAVVECWEKAIPAELGSWADILDAGFSGEAVYTARFDAPESMLLLDLGEVQYAASVRLNGVGLGSRLWRPFRVDLTLALKRKNNLLEVSVINTLANALAISGTAEYLEKKFPPRSPYEDRQREFERESLSGGLFGPVRLFLKK